MNTIETLIVLLKCIDDNNIDDEVLMQTLVILLGSSITSMALKKTIEKGKIYPFLDKNNVIMTQSLYHTCLYWAKRTAEVGNVKEEMRDIIERLEKLVDFGKNNIK